MAIPGLGLDQSQLADVINQQYKGYSQKQRNQMMQSAAATPDNWSAITQQANQTATQPTEFLGAGRTSDIPTVSQNGQRLTGYDDSNLSSLYNMNSGYRNTPFDYTDSAGKGYYNTDTQNRIESAGPNFVSGAKTSYDLNPTQAGGYYFSDPWGFSHSLDKVGANNYFVSGNTLNQRTRSGTADTFFGLDPTKDLSGLRYGKHNNQEGLFFDPTKTNLSSLLTTGRNNSAYAEKKSGLGGLSGLLMGYGKDIDPQIYSASSKNYVDEADKNGILSATNSASKDVDPIGDELMSSLGKLFGYNSSLEFQRGVGEPIGNILGAIYGGGMPWGSLALATDNASTGNWEGVGNNAINGLASYAGSNVGPGGVMGTDVSLGSAAANSAANNMIINAGANYARTGDIENALKAAAFSTASGAAGNWLGSATAGDLGEIGSKALGGAASGGLNSLFTKNSPIEGSLFGAMSGGLHGFLNSTDRSNNTYSKQQDTKNRQTAQSVTKLAKLFTRK